MQGKYNFIKYSTFLRLDPVGTNSLAFKNVRHDINGNDVPRYLISDLLHALKHEIFRDPIFDTSDR